MRLLPALARTMTEERQRTQVDLVYMVTGVDKNGDTHIFVTADLRRAEARHRETKEQLADLKANWLDD